MNKIGLSLTVNKFTTYFESIPYFLICETLENARTEMVNILVTHYKKFHINYPHDLSDFEYQLFNQQYVKADAFVYKIYQNDRWEEPWDTQDIYDDVIENIVNEEIKNPPEFSEIYGEPDPDENIINKFTMENDECYQEMESKLKEIINQTNTVKFKEEQVKDCKCQLCQEGYDHQQSKKISDPDNIIV
jgi:hypothetical protein